MNFISRKLCRKTFFSECERLVIKLIKIVTLNQMHLYLPDIDFRDELLSFVVSVPPKLVTEDVSADCQLGEALPLRNDVLPLAPFPKLPVIPNEGVGDEELG